MFVCNLAYMGLGVRDVDAWACFALDMLGAQDGGVVGGARRIRMDDRSGRFLLEQSEADDILYAGFEFRGEEQLRATVDKLAAEGFSSRPMSDAELAGRDVRAGFVVQEPDGLPIELVLGLGEGAVPFRSAHDVTFATGAEGLGHMVLSASDVDRSLAFYKCLGFVPSDYISFDVGGGQSITATFLHCNERHHTLALAPGLREKRLNHIMVEVTAVDAVIQAYYRAQLLHVPIVYHLGRHTNDRMLSFYVRTPAGFDIEYGNGGIHIHPDWQTVRYDKGSIWGHSTESPASS